MEMNTEPMPTHDLACLHAVIDGQVQGVGFRFFALELAEAVGVTGWVRNCYDGTVEVMAQGRRSVLESFLEQLRRGPRGAYVTNVAVDWEPADCKFVQFEIRRTSYN
jgi:acylphosphatase